MLVGDFQVEQAAGRCQRTARTVWSDGEFELRIVVPTEFAAPADDAAPFLASTLLQAMRRGEDLDIEASVSQALLARCDQIQRIYRAWDPSLRPCKVNVAGTITAGERPSGRACFFSRGVDSMFSAGTTPGDGPLTHLVYCEDLDRGQDAEVSERDHQLAREVADRIGLPLLSVSTNIREMADPVVDWSDLFGAGLSSVAHCLGGGVGTIVIPSSADQLSQGPCGSHPLLDPLFSTERVRVVHGTIDYSRPEKVAALAAQRPDLVPSLRVCGTNAIDNCGRCMKCLWTMVCLEAAGALPAAKSFPEQIPPELIRRIRLSYYLLQIGWMQALQALPADDRTDDLRAAIEDCLYRSAHPGWRERAGSAIDRLRGKPEATIASGDRPEIRFLAAQTNLAISLLRDGKPYELGAGRFRRPG